MKKIQKSTNFDRWRWPRERETGEQVLAGGEGIDY